jgi:hypothetical protein
MDKNVFPGSDLPWSLPEYKGDPDKVFDVSNAIEAAESHFNVQIHESWTQLEVDDFVSALVKIESHYGVAEVEAVVEAEGTTAAKL